nr:uncharacterized protein LOC112730717 [Arachis hypogaea]
MSKPGTPNPNSSANQNAPLPLSHSATVQSSSELLSSLTPSLLSSHNLLPSPTQPLTSNSHRGNLPTSSSSNCPAASVLFHRVPVPSVALALFHCAALPSKVGLALACDNTIVLKNAEQTPLFALYAAKLFHEVDIFSVNGTMLICRFRRYKEA